MNISKNDNLMWKIIEDPEEIEVFLILRNKQYFRLAHHTHFTIESFKSKIANCDSQLYIIILERTANLEKLKFSHIKHQRLLELK